MAESLSKDLYCRHVKIRAFFLGGGGESYNSMGFSVTLGAYQSISKRLGGSEDASDEGF